MAVTLSSGMRRAQLPQQAVVVAVQGRLLLVEVAAPVVVGLAALQWEQVEQETPPTPLHLKEIMVVMALVRRYLLLVVVAVLVEPEATIVVRTAETADSQQHQPFLVLRSIMRVAVVQVRGELELQGHLLLDLGAERLLLPKRVVVVTANLETETEQVTMDYQIPEVVEVVGLERQHRIMAPVVVVGLEL